MSNETRGLARHDRVLAAVVGDQSFDRPCLTPLVGPCARSGEAEFSRGVGPRAVHPGAAVGRAVWALIEQGRLEPSVIALIRDEVRPCLSPGRAAAFIGTVFELPTMPVGSAEQPVKSATAVPLAEPDVPPASAGGKGPLRTRLQDVAQSCYAMLVSLRFSQ